MNLKAAQKDMRFGYLGGGPGALVSGTVWITAGMIALLVSSEISIVAFFFGGIAIHPLGVLVCKLFNRPGKHSKDNPLVKLATETLVVLFAGLFIAYVVFYVKQDCFFPIMLLTIGARYVLFQTLYDLKIYWLLGGALMIGGALCLISNQVFHIGAFVGGGIELIFAGIIIRSELKTPEIKDINATT